MNTKENPTIDTHKMTPEERATFVVRGCAEHIPDVAAACHECLVAAVRDAEREAREDMARRIRELADGWEASTGGYRVYPGEWQNERLNAAEELREFADEAVIIDRTTRPPTVQVGARKGGES